MIVIQPCPHPMHARFASLNAAAYCSRKSDGHLGSRVYEIPSELLFGYELAITPESIGRVPSAVNG